MKYLMILCLLIVFVNRSNGCGRQDSIKIFSTQQLKDESRLLDELEYRRAKDSIDNKQIDSLVKTIDEYKIINGGAKSIIELKNDQIDALETQVEVVRPAWYDNFAIGSAVTATILALIFIFLH